MADGCEHTFTGLCDSVTGSDADGGCTMSRDAAVPPG